jgi:hypothetical protein
VLLLVVRGLPSLLIYARVLPVRERIEMTFITATTMPLPARGQIRAAMNAASVPSVASESRLRSSAATSTP